MEIELNRAYLGDCIEIMKKIPDKYFDLCLTDPPYGINMDGGNIGKSFNHDKKSWDSKIPDKIYFDELKRISKNQIIWGGNYFTEFLEPSRCWVVWDKNKAEGKETTFAQGELAWTSFDENLRIFKYTWDGFIQGEAGNKIKEEKYHPTQKPISLMEYCLEKFSKEGDKIIDIYGGSGTTAIACINKKRDFVICEKEESFYKIITERIEKATASRNFSNDKKVVSKSIFDILGG